MSGSRLPHRGDDCLSNGPPDIVIRQMTTPVTRSAATQLSPAELRAWGGMLRVHSRLVKVLDARLDGDHGLPLTSYEVLVHLSEADGGRMRMCDLAESILLSRSGLTRLVDRLERDGLLERVACADDARGSFATLTPAGREKLAEARVSHLEGVRSLFLEHFSEAELTELGRLWSRILPDEDLTRLD
jgi:DNA-binding MarR family transcriptional regulator